MQGVKCKINLAYIFPAFVLKLTFSNFWAFSVFITLKKNSVLRVIRNVPLRLWHTAIVWLKYIDLGTWIRPLCVKCAVASGRPSSLTRTKKIIWTVESQIYTNKVDFVLFFSFLLQWLCPWPARGFNQLACRYAYPACIRFKSQGTVFSWLVISHFNFSWSENSKNQSVICEKIACFPWFGNR